MLAGALIASLVLETSQAGADSFDLTAPARASGWSAKTHQAKSTPAKSFTSRSTLKWRGEASSAPRWNNHSSQRGNASEIETSGPKLTAPTVRRALHEVEQDTEVTGEIQLVSFSEVADDPADDPFEDGLTEDDNTDEIELLDANMELADGNELALRDPLDLDELSQMPEDEDDLRPRMPSLGEAYAEAGPGEPERCPSPRDLKPINQIDHRIAAEPGLFPVECALSEEPFKPRNFALVDFTWKASGLCHKPLYFQQPKLERYGHTFGPVLTPIISMGHFFVMVPALPYNMGLEPYWECVYPLGWYRPGDCAPYTLGPLPLSAQAAATQGVMTTGLWFLFP